MKRTAALLSLVLASACATERRQLVGANHLARFESLELVLESAAKSSCLKGLAPIPATVIDVGVFKNVPYQSFSNGVVELNAYGDPSNLVALEAGTKNDDVQLKRCLIQFVATQTISESDRQRALLFDETPRARTDGGLTMETTAPDAVDAYGAWWFSIELTESVGDAAATDDEMRAVSTTSTHWSAPPLVPTSSAPPLVGPSYTPSYNSYRPSGGRVFVHGYTKKNGTYVHAHSRRR